MSYLVKILVGYKEGVLDPQARVIGKITKQLGYDLGKLSQEKLFSYLSKKDNEEEVQKEANELAKKILSNPTIEKYEIYSIKYNSC